MKQPIFTPPIEKCAVCGAEAKCIDWNFNMRYRVMCDKNHIATGEFNTRHRAICRWNNEQKKVTSNAKLTGAGGLIACVRVERRVRGRVARTDF